MNFIKDGMIKQKNKTQVSIETHQGDELDFEDEYKFTEDNQITEPKIFDSVPTIKTSKKVFNKHNVYKRSRTTMNLILQINSPELNQHWQSYKNFKKQKTGIS